MERHELEQWLQRYPVSHFRARLSAILNPTRRSTDPERHVEVRVRDGDRERFGKR